ncbi:MAG: glycosyl transferase family 2, partial [Fibrobacteres bacterium]|nr:glycosyl transferase family 2 [Fibrobacterota bacterium]
MKILLLLSGLALLYTYSGYPVLMSIYGYLFKRKRKTDDAYLPTVTLIIPAHNEEDCIEKKIRNALELD